MIADFKCKDTERLWLVGIAREFPPDIHRTAVRKLLMLDAAPDLRTLASNRGLHLEVLRGERAGQHSIRINDQWRICFVWDGNAHAVEIVDYD